MAITRITLAELNKRPVNTKNLEALASLPDEQIDFSEMPELSAEQLGQGMPFNEFLAKRRNDNLVNVTIKKQVADKLHRQASAVKMSDSDFLEILLSRRDLAIS